MTVKYCSECAGILRPAVPRGDDRERLVCERCDFVVYENPKIVAGCLVAHKGRVLLCRRLIPPELGRFTLPAGYMENGESTEQAACREAWEEARAEVDIDDLYFVIDFPQINQIYLIFRGQLKGFNTGRAGHESGRVGLFAPADIPWDELAFEPVVRLMIEAWVEDSPTAEFPLRRLKFDNLELWEPPVND